VKRAQADELTPPRLERNVLTHQTDQVGGLLNLSFLVFACVHDLMKIEA
jgi:hypothetical protein